MNLPAIPFLVELTSSYAVFTLFLRPQPASETARKRLTIIQDSVRPRNFGADAAELKEPGRQGFPASLGAFLERYSFAKRLKILLVHADSRMGVGGAVLVSAGIALGCGVASFLLLPWLPLSAVAGLAGAGVPYAVLRVRRGRRLKAFNAALPDAIDLMARSLRAGHSVGASIEVVAEQSPQPLAFEFFQVYQQQRLGLQFRDSLQQMGARVPSRDLQFLVTAILVQKETGGDLTEILDRASYVIRERVRIEGEVRTRTAQGRLTGWILGSLPLILLALINMINPGYSTILFHDPIGQDMLYIGATMILVGAFIIRKIVDVKV